MIKLMFDGHLLRLFQSTMTIVTPYGDKYSMTFTDNPDNPFIIRLVKKYNHEDDHEQLQFERELKAERIY